MATVLKVLKDGSAWVLRNGAGELCRAENVEFDEALDVFAADWPEHSSELDQLKCDDFCGTVAAKKTREKFSGQKKRGSGARFRELILQGKSNEECVKIVREEFPESTATLSDAAWQRAQLRKNPSGFLPNGFKKS